LKFKKIKDPKLANELANLEKQQVAFQKVLQNVVMKM